MYKTERTSHDHPDHTVSTWKPLSRLNGTQASQGRNFTSVHRPNSGKYDNNVNVVTEPRWDACNKSTRLSRCPRLSRWFLSHHPGLICVHLTKRYVLWCWLFAWHQPSTSGLFLGTHLDELPSTRHLFHNLALHRFCLRGWQAERLGKMRGVIKHPACLFLPTCRLLWQSRALPGINLQLWAIPPLAKQQRPTFLVQRSLQTTIKTGRIRSSEATKPATPVSSLLNRSNWPDALKPKSKWLLDTSIPAKYSSLFTLYTPHLVKIRMMPCNCSGSDNKWRKTTQTLPQARSSRLRGLMICLPSKPLWIVLT